MKRWVIALLLVACGGKKDEPPKPTAAGDVSAIVTAPTNPLDEARRILSMTKKRDPEAWVALAHAQVAAKQTDAAKVTLEEALSAARADKEGAPALVMATEVMLALGDSEGAAKL